MAEWGSPRAELVPEVTLWLARAELRALLTLQLGAAAMLGVAAMPVPVAQLGAALQPAELRACPKRGAVPKLAAAAALA